MNFESDRRPVNIGCVWRALVVVFSFVILSIPGVGEDWPSTYREDFNDNLRHWNVGEFNGGSATIQNGVYTVKKQDRMGSWFLTQAPFIDYTADYEIEVKIRWLGGTLQNGFGLNWASRGQTNLNSFLISASKQYRVYQQSFGRFEDVVSWTPSEGIKGGKEWNIITVQKRGSAVNLLVNGSTITSIPELPVFGRELSIILNDDMMVEIDYLEVRQVLGPIKVAPDAPKDVSRENLGPKVNCDGGDLAPVITADGKRIYFGRYPFEGNTGTPEAQDVYYTDLQKDGSWGAATNAGRPWNNESANYLISITPDGNTAVLGNTYYPNGQAKGPGASVSYRTADGWSVPTDVYIDNYYNRNKYAEMCLDPSGRVMIMTIERDDTYGEKDLYVSVKDSRGIFSSPRNCGPVVNTWGNEVSPFMAADGVTLYFATDGRRGYGAMDIWMTKRLDESWLNWSEPLNLGPFINTDGWDAYFTVPAKGDYAYLSTSNPANNSADIYRVKLSKGVRPNPVVLVSGRVLDAKTKKPLAASVQYENLTTNKSAGTARSAPKDGAYKVSLPAGTLYGFRAEAEGYYPISDQLDTRDLTEYKEINRDLFLVPLKKDETVVLNNVFFDFSSTEVRAESFPELNRLVDFLQKNPKISIEVYGHTDNIGTNADNVKLSQERVNAVKTYLVSKSVSDTRIKAIGFGESKPIASNNSEEGRQKNRRVEFKIVNM